MGEHYKIFKRNLPYIVRSKEKALEIIANKDNKFIDIKDNNKLVATSIINKNTILLLCVDEGCRNKGLGTKLLNESEKYIKNHDYKEVILGVGFDYLMPGVPMKSKAFNEKLNEDDLYNNINDCAYYFFKKRGYYNSWIDANCFDMRVNLKNLDLKEKLNDTINGITYRLATINDLENIIRCTDDGWSEFTEFYKNQKLYDKSSKERALIALDKNIVCGTLIISIGTEEKDTGSVGCTVVSNKYRGKHIGVNMVRVGTNYLKSLGLKRGFLGYTYSGLDKMYGYAGYKICIYYFMGKKNL